MSNMSVGINTGVNTTNNVKYTPQQVKNAAIGFAAAGAVSGLVFKKPIGLALGVASLLASINCYSTYKQMQKQHGVDAIA